MFASSYTRISYQENKPAAATHQMIDPDEINIKWRALARKDNNGYLVDLFQEQKW
jgi:hypothetical protein